MNEADLIPVKGNYYGRDDDGILTILKPDGTRFEFTAEWVTRFHDNVGRWVSREFWPKVKVISICHTTTCMAFNMQLEVELDEHPDGIFRAICGLCQRTPTLYKPA